MSVIELLPPPEALFNNFLIGGFAIRENKSLSEAKEAFHISRRLKYNRDES